MNLPPDLQFTERFIKPFTLTPNWFSLLRIFLWFTFFVITFHFITPSTEPKLPYLKEMKSAGITPLATTPSDPRYMRLDQSTVPDNSIIWVGGSSLAIKEEGSEEYTYLPSQVETNTNQYLSIKMGSRLLDTYTMTLDAIKRKPDALFIAFNPFWIMNDNAFFFKTNIMNSGTSLWNNKTDWPLIPLLSSPGNMLWSVIGKHHKVIGNGYDYLKILVPKTIQKPKKNKPSDIKPLQGRQKIVNKTITVKNKLSYNKPIIFWIDQRFEKHKETRFNDTSIWQEKIMTYQNPAHSILAQDILKNLFYHIKQSNIPTLVYLAPTNYNLTETSALSSYRAVQAQVNTIADTYKSNNIRLIALPEWVYDSLIFKDYLHLSDSGELPHYLSAQINMIMEGK